MRSNENESREQPDAKKPRLFVYGGRTAEGVETVLDKARKHPKDLNFHALAAETSNMPTETFNYRGFTVLNSANKESFVEVSMVKLFFSLRKLAHAYTEIFIAVKNENFL